VLRCTQLLEMQHQRPHSYTRGDIIVHRHPPCWWLAQQLSKQLLGRKVHHQLNHMMLSEFWTTTACSCLDE
jgi:hypothetical protein